MNMNSTTSLFFKTLFTLLIGGASAATAQDKTPELLFQSGFEGTTRVVPFRQDANDIVGSDPKLLLSDWEKLQESGVIENVYVNYTGGDPSKRYAKIIHEPGNPENHVLHFWLNDSWLASENQVKARVQVEFYDIKGGLQEFRQSVRVFIHEDFNVLRDYPHPIHWLTISEFWNKEWWVDGEKYGFRITLGIGKPTAESKELYFTLNGEDAGQKEIWNANQSRIKVPIGKWFTMDYYYKEGNKDTGRFYMTITPDNGAAQVVFDVNNFTHMTKNPAPQGLTGYNPMKLYTSKELVQFVKSHGKTLQIYWDDIKLWKDYWSYKSNNNNR